MLLRNPGEFAHKAREWAVRHAGASPRDQGEGSGGATAESLQRQKAQAKEKEAKARLEA